MSAASCVNEVAPASPVNTALFRCNLASNILAASLFGASAPPDAFSGNPESASVAKPTAIANASDLV